MKEVRQGNTVYGSIASIKVSNQFVPHNEEISVSLETMETNVTYNLNVDDVLFDGTGDFWLHKNARIDENTKSGIRIIKKSTTKNHFDFDFSRFDGLIGITKLPPPAEREEDAFYGPFPVSYREVSTKRIYQDFNLEALLFLEEEFAHQGDDQMIKIINEVKKSA